MKKIIFLFALLLTQPLAAFHIGVGFSWNTICETFNSNLHTNTDKSGKDHYEVSKNRLAPVVQLGHQFPFCNDWEVGILAQWKYFNHSNRGQVLPNATFSSINFFGPQVIRDFTSITRVKNEVMLLGSVGKGLLKGYAYLGIGPILFTAANSLYVSSVHTPNGTGDHLISTSVTSHKTTWGGAAQVGYQYCIDTKYFINISYTYSQTGKNHFDNTINAAILNGADNPDATTLFLRRSIKLTSQEFMCSVNLVF